MSSDYRLNLKDKPLTWGYVAGFTDGEGCIFFRNYENRRGITVGISWSQAEDAAWVLCEIADFLRERDIVVSERVYDHPQLKCGEARRITVQRQEDVRHVLMHLLPYLIVKLDDAIRCLEKLDEWQATKGRKKSLGRDNAHKRKGIQR